MIQVKHRFSSFEEYLAFEDDTDALYELFNGELIELPPESGLNVGIINFLFVLLVPLVGHLRLRGHGLELEVRGEPRNRYPDLTVIREDHISQLQKRNTIRLSMPAPVLVVEVVSPGELQRDRDYVAKRSQYQDRGIPEYWIIDPEQQLITVFVLQDSQYETAGLFQGKDLINSPAFPGLKVTAAQILAAGQPG